MCRIVLTDIFSKSMRKEIMRKIKSKNTKLDQTMEKLLKKHKISFIQYPQIFGHPDFLILEKIAVFCDSSFWHGRNWPKLKKRLSDGNNPEYWLSHISTNRKRDKVVSQKLTSQGYVVLRFWDDMIYKKPELCMQEIIDQIKHMTTT